MDKCTFAWLSRRISPLFLAAIGGATAKELFSDWINYNSDFFAVLDGSKQFFDISPDAQFFIISVILLALIGLVYGILGRIQYENWNCWRKYERKR